MECLYKRYQAIELQSLVLNCFLTAQNGQAEELVKVIL